MSSDIQLQSRFVSVHPLSLQYVLCYSIQHHMSLGQESALLSPSLCTMLLLSAPQVQLFFTIPPLTYLQRVNFELLLH